MIANSLPQKEIDSSSMSSTLIEKEPVMECPLLLTTGEALRGDTGFASVFGPQNEGHKFTRKCNLTLDTSMAKPTPRPLLRMVEREEYLECLGPSVERPV